MLGLAVEPPYQSPDAKQQRSSKLRDERFLDDGVVVRVAFDGVDVESLNDDEISRSKSESCSRWSHVTRIFDAFKFFIQHFSQIKFGWPAIEPQTTSFKI